MRVGNTYVCILELWFSGEEKREDEERPAALLCSDVVGMVRAMMRKSLMRRVRIRGLGRVWMSRGVAVGACG